jgi:hypothetical protein
MHSWYPQQEKQLTEKTAFWQANAPSWASASVSLAISVRTAERFATRLSCAQATASVTTEVREKQKPFLLHCGFLFHERSTMICQGRLGTKNEDGEYWRKRNGWRRVVQAGASARRTGLARSATCWRSTSAVQAAVREARAAAAGQKTSC